MNQPTREEFDQLAQRVARIEQRTEEIKVTRIEVASEDVLKRLESMDKKLDRIDQKQDEHAKGLISHSRSISMLQTEMKEARADILKMRESQADLRDAIEKTATKDDIAAIRAEHGELLRQILDRLPLKQ